MPSSTISTVGQSLASNSAPTPGSSITAPATYSKPHSCDEGQYYPVTAMQEGAEGTTRVSLIVDVHGGVSSTAVAISSGRADLDTASLECAKTWQYRPAIKEGVPVETRVLADISWEIRIAPPFSVISRTVAECVYSTDEGRDEAKRAPLHAVTRVHFTDGRVVSVSLAGSSGIPDLDNRTVACAESLPPELTAAIGGDRDALFALYPPETILQWLFGGT